MCRAVLNGGGMYLASTDARCMQMEACNITSNSAGKDGGGLHVSNGAVVLAHSTFASNSADGRGGAVVYMQESFMSGMPAPPQPCISKFSYGCTCYAASCMLLNDCFPCANLSTSLLILRNEVMSLLWHTKA